MASRSISFGIRSNAAQFASSMARAASSTRGFGRAADSVQGPLRRMDDRLAAIATRRVGAAIAGYFTASAVRRATQYATSLTTISAGYVEVGKAIGEASDDVEVFHRVLRGDGANFQQINQGLVQLTRNIGLAVQGTGPALPVFERLGITLVDSAGRVRGSLAVYRDLVQALERVDSASRTAALGLAIGEEAARVWGASAAQGLDALDRALQRERSFGVATDADNQILKGVADTVRTVGDAINTLGRVVLAEFAPAIDRMLAGLREAVGELINLEQRTGNISDAINEFLGRVREFLSTTARSVRVVGQAVFSLTLFGRAFRILRGLVEKVKTVLAPVVTLLLNLLGAAGVFGALEDLQQAFVGLFEPLSSLLRPLREVDGAAAQLNESMATLSDSFERLQRVKPAQAAQFVSEFDRINRLSNAIERGFEALQLPPTSRPGAFVFATEAGLAKARDRVIASARRLNQDLIEALFTPPPAASADRIVEQLGQQLTAAGAQRQLQRIYERVFPPDFETLKDVGFSEKITTRLDGTAVAMERVGDRLNDIGTFAAAAASNLTSTFADALLEARSFRDVLGDIGKLLYRLAVQSFIGAPLARLLGNLGGDGGFAGYFNTGGYIPAGKWGIAGERGPEPVLGPATVLPDLSKLQGGGDTYVVRVEGNVNPDEVVAVVETVLPGIVARAKDGSLRDRRYRRALSGDGRWR